jgi:hypothetical protein
MSDTNALTRLRSATRHKLKNVTSAVKRSLKDNEHQVLRVVKYRNVLTHLLAKSIA